MDFLKEILGEELFNQVAEKINAHNGNEANKDKQIKIGNLGGGEYVSKGKHESELERLNALLSGKDADIQTMTATLESLKKGKVDADAIQQKLSETERLLAESKFREDATKAKYALRDLLREAEVSDVDYAEYLVNKKLTEDGKAIELDESEHIKGKDDLISGLKTQSPNLFKKADPGFKVDPNPLPQPNNNGSGVTKEQFNKMGYQSRLKLKQEQPEVYAQMTGKETN